MVKISKSDRRKRATVKEIIKRIFPEGTNETGKSCDDPPAFPPDVFAAAAFLLERSGLYVYLSPGERHIWGQPWFFVDPHMKETWFEAAQQWKRSPKTPIAVQNLWKELYVDSGNAEFTLIPEQNEPMPRWVTAAFGLMYIADEACSDVGYLHHRQITKDSSWIALNLLDAEIENIKRSVEAMGGNATHTRIKHHQYSITKQASLDMVSVQPKAHTSQVGLSMRAISQNLALLPSPSRMAATWNRITGNIEGQTGLNILLIPYPFEIEAHHIHKQIHGDPDQPSWGWFDVRQGWLPDKHVLFEFVSALIQRAEEQSQSPVDVLVFPELSLSWVHHEYLVDNLAKAHRELEFVVSGSSTNCDGHAGNFALTSSINWDGPNHTIHTNSRGKHHRWRLDEGQIKMYDLEESLPGSTSVWWEKISVARRLVHTHVFRNNSCFTTFICEDLARSDPAHETVRALGPSIVFCLLMDGPQLTTRWGARYALGLVEDPGSAVLTFTSRGLMQRTRNKALREADGEVPDARSRGKAYPRAENWSVGLWRDVDSGPVELHCPPPDHAVMLKLKAAEKADHSYDGRVNGDGVSWRYESSQTIRLPVGDPALAALEKAKA
ncbi:hypothetical protein [Sinorhizobium alkalisoli]|uniref:Uncharacterized protein n=1 Tax=Sinorhizobium alkalisoli TaxID=1752398 RepID=A0A1E3VH46_9HYPH|nr:hypothetical protein [Sinorhizobium alkalisoli]ODR92895.1 hypothetical protein A8M32_02430 [Sinorhizobium alkalisoli]